MHGMPLGPALPSPFPPPPPPGFKHRFADLQNGNVRSGGSGPRNAGGTGMRGGRGAERLWTKGQGWAVQCVSAESQKRLISATAAVQAEAAPPPFTFSVSIL
eukprot:350904-Chlamydomonas_euryale.AAC.2